MRRKSLVSGFAAVALMLTGLSAVPVGVSDGQTRVTTTNQQAPKPAPVNPATNETEKERYERLKGIGRRVYRGVKNRRPGERAHRRWRFKRAAGRA